MRWHCHPLFRRRRFCLNKDVVRLGFPRRTGPRMRGLPDRSRVREHRRSELSLGWSNAILGSVMGGGRPIADRCRLVPWDGCRAGW